MPTQQTSIFRRPAWVVFFALTAAIAWGWAYPLIKLGFGEFGIQPDMTGSKTLFAGIRFSMSGLIILSLAKATRRPFAVRKGSDWWYILLFALVNTTLHYAFFYFGLSHSEGARAAILNSMSVFLLVILACIFFESDRFTLGKALGCVLGFAGIMALNLGSEASGKFTFLGDGMIILNALCSAVAGLLTRGLSKRIDVFVGTGFSLFLGGILLVIP
ncbi:MAG: DMT family transporter, partial [Bacteroidaceae bacterium]|nr:DMT family transporter [Bacteroidaceae bacterium]